MYCAWDVGGGFLDAARGRTRRLVELVLADCPPPPFRVEAPPWLHVTGWRQAGGRLVFHLLQAQGSIARFPEKVPYTVLEDTPPVTGVRISLAKWAAWRAWLPLENRELALEPGAAGEVATRVPCVERHQVVVFETRGRDP